MKKLTVEIITEFPEEASAILYHIAELIVVGFEEGNGKNNKELEKGSSYSYKTEEV